MDSDGLMKNEIYLSLKHGKILSEVMKSKFKMRIANKIKERMKLPIYIK